MNTRRGSFRRATGAGVAALLRDAKAMFASVAALLALGATVLVLGLTGWAGATRTPWQTQPHPQTSSRIRAAPSTGAALFASGGCPGPCARKPSLHA